MEVSEDVTVDCNSRDRQIVKACTPDLQPIVLVLYWIVGALIVQAVMIVIVGIIYLKRSIA